MLLSNLSLIFKFIILAFIYGIIYYALKVMHRDINNEGAPAKEKTMGLEIIDIGNNINLKRGALVPINRRLTIGRGKRNILQLHERYVSNKHAVIKSVGKGIYVEDLKSTNGTLLNHCKIEKKEWIKPGDIIKIGTSVFKVIG